MNDRRAARSPSPPQLLGKEKNEEQRKADGGRYRERKTMTTKWFPE